MRTRRVTLMHNPKAGHGKHKAEELLALFDAAGMKVKYHSTKIDGYEHALDAPCDFVVAAGGDGTVRKVCKHLVGSDVPVAILPLGTANNFAQSHGIHGDLRKLIAALPSAPVTAVDVGIAKGPWGRKIFFEAMGIGLFPDAIDALGRNARPTGKTPEARLKHVLRAMKKCLPKYEGRHVQATLDDADISGDFLLLEAMNISLVGPNLFVAPHADSGDGLLEVVVLTQDKRGAFGEYLSRRLKDRHSPPDLHMYRGRRLRLVWRGDVVHIDSKMWPKRANRKKFGAAPLEIVTVTLEKHALKLMLPR